MIAIGCDHAAVGLKEIIIKHLSEKNIIVKDCGTFEKGVAVDYSDYALKVCDSVLNKESELGIVICGTGIGMSIAANKVNGIRCALCGDTFSAKATKAHNNANVLALGERVTGAGLALEIVDAFLQTPFSNEERHVKRINKVMDIEKR